MVISCPSTLLISFLTAWFLVHPRARDPYPFLEGHDLVDTGVIGPGTNGPKEIRVYSWKESWQSVATRARRDMHDFGLSEEPRRKGAEDAAVWLGGSIFRSGLEGTNAELIVEVMKGRHHELRESKPVSDEDLEWVTVEVASHIDESWANVVRYTFFPVPR